MPSSMKATVRIVAAGISPAAAAAGPLIRPAAAPLKAMRMAALVPAWALARAEAALVRAQEPAARVPAAVVSLSMPMEIWFATRGPIAAILVRPARVAVEGTLE